MQTAQIKQILNTPIFTLPNRKTTQPLKYEH